MQTAALGLPATVKVWTGLDPLAGTNMAQLWNASLNQVGGCLQMSIEPIAFVDRGQAAAERLAQSLLRQASVPGAAWEASAALGSDSCSHNLQISGTRVDRHVSPPEAARE